MLFEDALKLLDNFTEKKNKPEFDKLMGDLCNMYAIDSTERVELMLKQLTFEFTLEYNFKKLEPRFEEVEDYILTSGNEQQKIRFLSNKGIIKTQLLKLDEALVCHKQSLDLCSGPETNKLLMGIYTNIGTAYNTKGSFKTALRYFLQAYHYSQKYNQHEPRFIYKILNNIGVIYRALDNNPKAIYYFNVALDTVLNTNISVPLPLLYNNLALAYINNGDFEEANAILEKFEQLPFEQYAHFALTHNRIKAFFLSKQNRYQESLDLLLEHIDEVRTQENNRDQAEYYITIINCYLSLNMPDEAGKYLDSASSIPGIMETPRFIEVIIDYYKTSKDYTAALEYSEKLVQVLITNQKQIVNESTDDMSDLLNTNQDSIAVTAYREKLDELKYLNIELKGQKDLLLNNLNTMKEERALRDKMISIITHDVRGPIGNVMQLLNLFDSIESQEEKDEIVQCISESITTTYKLIDDLVSWAKDVITGIDETSARITVADCIDEITDLYKNQLQKKSICLINNLTPGHQIKGEIMSIKTIFRNVIQNAVKYSHNNSEIIISEEFGDDSVTYLVTDSGVGMSPEEVAGLFKTGSASKIGTNNEAGFGLGILLVKELVNRNFGSISCESEINKGTTFKISFPIVEL
jgi:signal transduction histidine kinase